jgi:hypothetical protein
LIAIAGAGSLVHLQVLFEAVAQQGVARHGKAILAGIEGAHVRHSSFLEVLEGDL